MKSTQLPTTIVTGFLGSGKTTVINHLVEYLQGRSEKVAYIKNEFGEEYLDANLMVGQNIKAKELLNGCICCTLVGPFIASIDELIKTYQPDRLIIESAGTADPASLALMVANHPGIYRDGLLSIIDVVNFKGFESIEHIEEKQAEMTDLIVLNKVELADEEQKRRVVGYIRELNQYSPIVEAPHGKLNPELAFGVNLSELDQLLSQQVGSEHHHHPAEDQVNAFTFVTDQLISKKCLEKVIQDLPASIFRIKGVVNLQDVGWQVLNCAYKRSDYLSVPENIKSTQTRLIVIGFQVKSIRGQIEQKLNSCLLT